MVFNPLLNPTNDPNYLGYSKEPDKVKGDASLGTALEGIGKVVGEGAKALDTAFQLSQKEDLHRQITELVDKHTSGVTAADVPAIAGTGARGARFSAAGAQGVEDLGSGEAALPRDLKKSMDAVKRYSDAYRAGARSETMFQVELDARVRQMKNKWAGYGPEIDQMAESITNNMSGNRVRKQLLQDFNSMAASAGAADKAALSLIEKHSDAIQNLYPEQAKDLNWTKANIHAILPSLHAWESQMSGLNSKKAQFDRELEQGKVNKYRAGLIVSDEAFMMVKTFFSASDNTLKSQGIDITNLATDITKAAGKGADNEQVKALAQKLTVVRATISAELDTRLQKYARHLDPADYQARKEAAMSYISGLEKMLYDGQTSAANIVAFQLKMRGAEDTKKTEDSWTDARVMKVLANIHPDLANQYFMKLGVMEDVNKVHFRRAMGTILDKDYKGPVPKLQELMDSYKGDRGDKPVPSKDQRGTLEIFQKGVMDKDPEISARFVESVYTDPYLLSKMPNINHRIQAMTLLGQESVTNQIKTLPEDKRRLYYRFMNQTFESVAVSPSQDLMEAVMSKRNEFTFDPKTFQFTVREKNPREYSGIGVPGNQLTRATQDINQVLTLMKPVWEAQFGGDTERAIVHAAETIQSLAGSRFSEKSSRGNAIEELGKAIVKSVSGLFTPTEKSKDISTTVDTIPAGMSPDDFLKLLKEREKKGNPR